MHFFSKKYYIISIFILLSGCFTQSTKEQKVEFVADNGKINPLIIELLKLTDVVSESDTLSSIVDETQKHWLRKSGSERWDIVSDSRDNQEEIRKIFENFFFFSEIESKYTEYEYAFVLGALFERMKLRFEHLVNLWNKGVRFNSIVFLSGSRPAQEAQGENKDVLEKWANVTIEIMPQTETELLKFIYDHMVMPEEMRKLPVQIIDVPMLQNSDGTMRRPNTADTIEWWLKSNPQLGKVLAVSNQPYVWYQDSVLKTLLPSSFEVDTVGQACLPDQKIGLLLDTLARTLYQEKIRLENKK